MYKRTKLTQQKIIKKMEVLVFDHFFSSNILHLNRKYWKLLDTMDSMCIFPFIFYFSFRLPPEKWFWFGLFSNFYNFNSMKSFFVVFHGLLDRFCYYIDWILLWDWKWGVFLMFFGGYFSISFLFRRL